VSTDALTGALVLTLVAICIAAAVLLWRVPRPLFLFSCALIAVGVGYLLATGAAEDVGRSVRRFTSGHIGSEFAKTREGVCRGEHIVGLGISLILAPVFLPLALIVMFKYWHRPAPLLLVALLAAICWFSLAATPFPQRLARAVLPAEMLKLPGHCGQSTSRG
jgi:hypothetical protein